MVSPSVLYHLLKEIFLILEDGDRQLLSEFDLSVSRFFVMYHLGLEPGLSISELSDLMFCDKSNTTRLIKGMESNRLVERRRHPTDGRIWLLFLTPAGEEMRQQVLREHRAQNQKRFAAFLEKGEGDALVGVLEVLRCSLQQ